MHTKQYRPTESHNESENEYHWFELKVKLNLLNPIPSSASNKIGFFYYWIQKITLSWKWKFISIFLSSDFRTIVNELIEKVRFGFVFIFLFLVFVFFHAIACVMIMDLNGERSWRRLSSFKIQHWSLVIGFQHESIFLAFLHHKKKHHFPLVISPIFKFPPQTAFKWAS